MINFFAFIGLVFIIGFIYYLIKEQPAQQSQPKHVQSEAMKEVMTMLKDVFQFPKQNGVYMGSFINAFGKEEIWMLIFINSKDVYLYPVENKFQDLPAATIIRTVFQETHKKYKGYNGELVVNYTVTLQGVKMTFGNVKQVEINGILENNSLLAEISFKQNYETKISNRVKFHFVAVA